MITFLFFIALFIAAVLTVGLFGVSRRLAEIEVHMIQDSQQQASERRSHVQQWDRIELALAEIEVHMTQDSQQQASERRSHVQQWDRIELALADMKKQPKPVYRATPRYDFESTQIAALDEFKEKA